MSAVPDAVYTMAPVLDAPLVTNVDAPGLAIALMEPEPPKLVPMYTQR